MCKFLPFAHFYGLVIVLVLAVMLALPASAQTSSSSEAQSTGAILINIDKSRQKMTVFLDGVEKYVWPVSTGQAGYSTPSGTYTATSMNEIWYSKEWDNAPMPHSVFFRKDGYAIHGSYEVKESRQTRLAWLRAYLACECHDALCAGEEDWLKEHRGCTDRRHSGRRV